MGSVFCTLCNDTGVFETGNNDLPCSCGMGMVSLFNIAGVKGLVTGEEMELHFLNHSPRPIQTGRHEIDAQTLPGRTFNTIVENARRLASVKRNDDWFGCLETYRSAAPLFYTQETYLEGLAIIDKMTPKLLTGLDTPPGLRFILQGNAIALRAYPLGVCKTLQTFSKLISTLDPESVKTDVYREMMSHLMFGILSDATRTSTSDFHSHVLAKYFADSRVALFSTLRTA